MEFYTKSKYSVGATHRNIDGDVISYGTPYKKILIQQVIISNINIIKQA
jgi:hypothetical protein